ncbi:hypothetical protein CkaCkLH20_10712 [Colletotrichum karsti]|uniref:Virginiamycin B lyase n=1 Tax=Colletotrichum karsti TaxID=1095194 RepID=A0A9P6HUZ4_9PEZI|nr:uncharacterized protein CkaCkLH20_10712 [Colletotrichum karsti]KAF9871778.1 hypothetical protein CkaCkLH20_10712 [Colletotrichum karsti]
MMFKENSLLRLSVAFLQIASVAAVSPAKLVAQVPWAKFEDLAIRSNGNILITQGWPSPTLWELSGAGAEAATLHTHFELRPTVNALFGITETTPDVFAFVGSIVNRDDVNEAGTAAIWTMDFNKTPTPQPSLVARLPEAVRPDKVASIPQNPHIILVADSAVGVVWCVNTATANVTVGIQVPEMGASESTGPASGVSGLDIHDGYVWWTSAARGHSYRIKISDEGVAAAGAVAEVVRVLPAVRDLTFHPDDGSAVWVASQQGRIIAAGPEGKSWWVSGDDMLVGTSALQFGRTEANNRTLYAVTAEGNVVALDTTEELKLSSEPQKTAWGEPPVQLELV